MLCPCSVCPATEPGAVSRCVSVTPHAAPARLVATVNALLAVLVGWYTVSRTGHDIIRAREPLIYDWTWFVLLYFLYDLWAMYRVHAAKVEYRGSVGQRVRGFCQAKGLLILHHLVVTFLGGPAALVSTELVFI